ncbi:MAG: MiaB/RimO family radical SAM methylthiotransferase [Alkalispirochaetaceae bacterium]
MNHKRRIAFYTLGCKLNQYETDSLASQFRREGYEIVRFEQEADCYIINSCTVTNKADRKSRNAMNRALRRAGARLCEPVRSSVVVAEESLSSGRGAPDAGIAAEAPPNDAIVVMTGCFVDSGKERLERSDATYLVDNKRKNQIFSIVDSHFRGEIVDPERLDSGIFSFETPERLFHTRTTLKIQDGCDNFCTFCIIPFVRGRAASRPVEEVLSQAREAIRGGSKELVLTGVNMSRYLEGETDFAHLVHRVLEIPGDFRVRISSLEPDSLDERFVELFAHPKMAPHLHLCLQSGSDRILLEMRRMYTVSTYREIVERIRTSYPDFNITTDIIVGFPGEDDAEFQRTLFLAEELQFSHIHTFSYSRRNGTRAERMDGQVSEKVKHERSEAIRELSERSKRSYRSRFVGKEERLLVERVGTKAGRAIARGLGEHYLPIRVEGPAVKDMNILPNSFLRVRILALEQGDDPELIAEPV